MASVISHCLPGTSDTLHSFDSTRPDRLGERLIVPFVLVRVTRREVRDGFVEFVTVAQIFGHGDGVPGTGMRSGKSPATQSGIEIEAKCRHALDDRGNL